MGILILIIVIGSVLAWSIGRAFDAHERTRDYAAIVFAQANFDSLVDPKQGLITRESLRARSQTHAGEERKLILHMLDNMQRFGHSIGTEDGFIPMSSPMGYAFPIATIVHVYGISRADLAKAKTDKANYGRVQ